MEDKVNINNDDVELIIDGEKLLEEVLPNEEK